MEGAVRELLDERAIRAVVLRYCRGVDRMDRELVRSCYHDDATDSHGSFVGTVDEFLDWAWRLLGRYTTTMHFVGNLLVELHPTDPDVVLELQPLIDQCYRRAYEGAFDYNREPEPPLSGADAEWADRLLREKGVRTAPPAGKKSKRRPRPDKE